MDSPDQRISRIRASLRAFLWGLASLIPLLGLFFGLLAVHAGLAASRPPVDWNPAERYRVVGLVLGLLGLLISAFGWILLVAGILKAASV